MSTTKDRSGLTNGSLIKLQSRIHDIEPFLEKEGTFSSKDFDENMYKKQGTIDILIQTGALQASYVRMPGRRRRRYRWNPEIKQTLKEYLDKLDKLPCGHRPHVYNDPEVENGKLGCRYCAEEGEHPAYEKAFIQEFDI